MAPEQRARGAYDVVKQAGVMGGTNDAVALGRLRDGETARNQPMTIGALGGSLDSGGRQRAHHHADAASLSPAGRRLVVNDVEKVASELRARHPTPYERLVKPIADRVIATAFVIVASPVLLLIGMLVALNVGRPILFRQTRVGKDGTPFTVLKFRTMRPDRRRAMVPYRGPERRKTHKTPDDPRHTPVGRLLRMTSLDELPQLINVMCGQMSLVGPRPELIDLVRQYSQWQHTRHMVKPGLTGLWQTTERGAGFLLHECVDLDLRYISELSLRRDLAILCCTPVALVRNKGVI